MKKYLLISLLSIFFSIFHSNLSAQKNIQFILQSQYVMESGNIGHIFQPINPIEEFQKQNTITYCAGIMLGVPVGKRTEFDFGLLYSLVKLNFKNITESGIGSISGDSILMNYNNTYSLSAELNYLKLPLQVTFKANSDKKVSLTCFGGAYAAYLLNYTITTINAYSGVSSNQNYYPNFSYTDNAAPRSA